MEKLKKLLLENGLKETNKAEPPIPIEDFEEYPHLFVLGCLMDIGIKAERAWNIPNIIAKQLGSKEFSVFESKNESEYIKLFNKGYNGKKLHRFNEKMGIIFYKGVKYLREHYDGDASNIWNDNPRSCDIVSRFERFHGAGQKISTMAVNLLIKDYGVKVKDKKCIDISTDVHIMRVFKRLGLVEKENKKLVIGKARELNPEFPGLPDYFCWKLGRGICHPKNPECGKCPMQKACPKVI